MKKGDLIYFAGKRRPGYQDGYVPTTRGEVLSKTKDYVEVMLEDTVVSTRIPTANYIEGDVKRPRGFNRPRQELKMEGIRNAIQ